ncbi:MAG TPA: rhomboid family intramembrane serine protease [Patescibacteria group bacterium]|nr:rhomboid family intramembrane serine protease [Patescibacteria group bacterium]
MSFGPIHHEDFTLDGLTHEEFLALALKAAEQIGWEVDALSENSITLITPFRTDGSCELIEIKLDGTNADISSKSDGAGFGSKAQNQESVAEFISALNSAVNSSEVTNPRKTLEEYTDITDEPEISSTNLVGEAEQDEGKWWEIFKPQEGFFISPILININIVIFLLMAVSGVGIFEPEISGLLRWGGNFRPATLDGEWWRLLTSCFVHIGIIHLAMNMIALMYIGSLLEPVIGRIKFIFAYLTSGIAASAASLSWHSYTVSAGASGAIFGMFGVYLALITTNLFDPETRKALLKAIGIYIVINLVYGMKDGVDAAAHIGGLLSGIVIGYSYYVGLRDTVWDSKDTFGMAGSAFASIGYTAFVLLTTPNDAATYDKTMAQFFKNQEQALQLYAMPETSTADDYLREIRTKGLPAWKENTALLKTIEHLDIAPHLIERNKTLEEYSRLRLTTYELMEKVYAENTNAYDSALQVEYVKIDSVLKIINGE